MQLWQPIVVTIEDVTEQSFADGDTEIVAKLAGYAGELVLTKEVLRNLAKMFGKRTADWIGQRVTLYPSGITVMPAFDEE